MRIIIVDTPQEVDDLGADFMNQLIQKKADCVLGLATGSSPLGLYQRLIELNKSGETNFEQVTSFNLDEYLGLAASHPQSYRFFMNDHLFNHINIRKENTHVPKGDTDNPVLECSQYEEKIQQSGGIDLQLLGIGLNGHVGFNEPSSSLVSRTRIKTLTPSTLEANARFFKEDEFQPKLSITMGLGNILEAKKILLIAKGKNKAPAIKNAIEGAVSARCQASMLQMHQRTVVILDESAASELSDREFYKYVENINKEVIAEYKL